jgi:hypothetical protein
MESSWLFQVQGKRTAVRWGDVSEGTRTSEAAELMALVDIEDPAFTHIADALTELKNAGVELDETAVMTAIKLGRSRLGVKKPSRSFVTVRERSDQAAIVYYIRRGALIKIGTTVQPHKRFAALLPEEILSFEPGDRAVEQTRHRQFAHLRVGRTEHFRITPALLEHAQAMREQHGDPDPEWPTLGMVRQPKGRKGLPPAPTPTSPEMVTAAEGARQCGVAANTVHGWIHRGVLKSIGRNERGKPVYFLDHVLHFAVHSVTYMQTRCIA